eukprot:s294_g7.t1
MVASHLLCHFQKLAPSLLIGAAKSQVTHQVPSLLTGVGRNQQAQPLKSNGQKNAGKKKKGLGKLPDATKKHPSKEKLPDATMKEILDVPGVARRWGLTAIACCFQNQKVMWSASVLSQALMRGVIQKQMEHLVSVECWEIARSLEEDLLLED